MKRSPLDRTRMGFTLIELFVVILVIGLMSGLILTAVGGNDKEREVTGGIARMRSMMSLARTAALSRKQTTRLLINFDETDDDRFLRYATIVYLEDDNDTADPLDDTWRPLTDGEFMPAGVFFSPALSTGPAGSPELTLWEVSINPNTLAISPSGAPSSATNYALPADGRDPLTHSPGSDLWYVYQFSPNGNYTPPDAATPGTRLVIVDGVRTSTELIIPHDERDEIFFRAKGFVMFRSGKPMFFVDPEQIKDGNT